MQYRAIEFTGKKASRLFFGTAGNGFLNGENMDRLLDGVYELGVNALDTARVYGNSEASIGRWLKHSGVRENLIILSKGGHPDIKTGRSRINENEIREDIEKSLELLGTDYIDIYLLHRDDRNVPTGEILEILDSLKCEGKIKAFGGSNWSQKRIEEANNYAEIHGMQKMSVSSPNYSLALLKKSHWIGECVSLSSYKALNEIPWYEKNQMPIIAYSALGMGFLSGKLKSEDYLKSEEILGSMAADSYTCEENRERLKRAEEIAKEKGATVSQIALAWLFESQMNTFAIVSSSSTARVKENAGAFNISLTQEEMKYLSYFA